MVTEKINIGCCCNNAYVQHLGVMIYSLLKNCSCPEKVNVYLIDGGITKENKEKLNSVIKEFNARIFYIKPNLKEVKKLKACRHITKEAYYRFQLIDSLKKNRLIYLDSDMIILGDILKIYDKKFSENIIFAVKDPGGSQNRKKILGIARNKYYFNSGVLLINCKKWRKEKISKKTIEFIKKNPEKIEYCDQDGLNVILKNTWKEINPEWNIITRLFYYKYLPFLKIPNYENEDIKKIIDNAKIIHYAGFIKPWFFLDPCPFKNIYWQYLKETPWKDYKYPDRNFLGFLKRIFFYLEILKNKFKTIF